MGILKVEYVRAGAATALDTGRGVWKPNREQHRRRHRRGKNGAKAVELTKGIALYQKACYFSTVVTLLHKLLASSQYPYRMLRSAVIKIHQSPFLYQDLSQSNVVRYGCRIDTQNRY